MPARVASARSARNTSGSMRIAISSRGTRPSGGRPTRRARSSWPFVSSGMSKKSIFSCGFDRLVAFSCKGHARRLRAARARREAGRDRPASALPPDPLPRRARAACRPACRDRRSGTLTCRHRVAGGARNLRCLLVAHAYTFKVAQCGRGGGGLRQKRSRCLILRRSTFWPPVDSVGGAHATSLRRGRASMRKLRRQDACARRRLAAQSDARAAQVFAVADASTTPRAVAVR